MTVAGFLLTWVLVALAAAPLLGWWMNDGERRVKASQVDLASVCFVDAEQSSRVTRCDQDGSLKERKHDDEI